MFDKEDKCNNLFSVYLRVVERGRVKCGQYWPLEAGRTEDYGYFLVRNVHIEMFQDFKLSHLELFNTQVSFSLFLGFCYIILSRDLKDFNLFTYF